MGFVNELQNGKFDDIAFLALRIFTGLLIALAGFGKLTNPTGPLGMFQKWFGPGLGTSFFWLVAATELIVGILLILGLFSRLAGLALVVVMLVAILRVHLPGLFANGYYKSGLERPLLFLGPALLFLAKGSGKYSISSMMKK